uniref:Uncharacterized protein n=1 Tax=Solanum lycopersicum TaxID=4081 RepID=A0A3Q7FJ78_SOLLC
MCPSAFHVFLCVLMWNWKKLTKWVQQRKKDEFVLDTLGVISGQRNSLKWLRVSKKPWPLGKRFVVPVLTGPAAVQHLNSKLRSYPLGYVVMSDPLEARRSLVYYVILKKKAWRFKTSN